jgi:hypothetical protein
VVQRGGMGNQAEPRGWRTKSDMRMHAYMGEERRDKIEGAGHRAAIRGGGRERG